MKVGNASVNREISLLKTILNTAVLWEKILRNPIAGKRVKRLEETNQGMRILTSEEALRLIDRAAMRLRPFLIVALQTGMRRNEILSLQWKDVDFTSSEIRVDAETSKSKKEHFGRWTGAQGHCRNSKCWPLLRTLRRGDGFRFCPQNVQTKKEALKK
jgi:integrase